MRWHELAELRERRARKLAHLARARARGLTVPQTWWAPAGRAPTTPPEALVGRACIVRSASFAEDTLEATAAGRFETVAVEELAGADRAGRDAFARAVRTVADSVLEEGPGLVFVQPLLRPERGGVAFFDGFWFERTEAPGGNRRLTAGVERGEVLRGHVERDDAFSAWLARLARVFRRELASAGALDLEYAADGESFTLLQARAARFEVRRNPLLSLANHREILGPAPSPWIVSALVLAGRTAVEEFERIDGEVARWDEAYAIAASGRAWLNLSFFFRLMDRWGLPRSFVTDGVGGSVRCDADRRVRPGRFLASAPKLVRLQVGNLRTMARAARGLRQLQARIEGADTLPALFEATVAGLGLALRTNFAINGAWTGVERPRRALGVRGRGEVVTERLMAEFDALRGRSGAELERALDRWLERYGHRGPLESDPIQPRFSELRSELLEGLAESAPVPPRASGSRVGSGLWFAIDRRREAFRDDLMRVWRRLRERILEVADRAGLEGDAVFFLGSADLESPPEALAELARLGRARHAEHAATEPPFQARLDELTDGVATRAAAGRADGELHGIGLGPRDVEGTVRHAKDLVELLRDRTALGPDTVLVVPALEPSWAVVFGRVAGVVTELGGELSHASILLREAGVPAVVNVPGACDLPEGARVRLEARSGRVVLQR